MTLNTVEFEKFISAYPVYEYRIVPTAGFVPQERVRTICREECERYGTTWACPPAVGPLSVCQQKICAYPQGVFFSSVAEVSDLMNMEEMLSTRHAHEELTEKIGGFLREQGFEIYILSTESCDICTHCTYPEGKPCRHPDRMHPCLESHGVVVQDLVERYQMDYNIGGNTILWFSLVLFREPADGQKSETAQKDTDS